MTDAQIDEWYIPMDPMFRDRQWHAGLAEPQFWALSAGSLAIAADLLWDRSLEALKWPSTNWNRDPSEVSPRVQDLHLLSVAMMLSGYAVENLLKGLAVKAMTVDAPMTENDERIRKLCSTHRLRDVAEKTKLPFDKTEEAFLQKLEDFILWKGRYARPKEKDKFLPLMSGKLNQVRMTSCGEVDRARYEQLRTRLFALL